MAGLLRGGRQRYPAPRCAGALARRTPEPIIYDGAGTAPGPATIGGRWPRRRQRRGHDRRIHYVKKSGATAAKVFKLQELTLAPAETVTLTREQQIRDFTTRVHHPGRHDVEIVVNGERLARSCFGLGR